MFVAADETLFHMLVVDRPTLPIAVTPAMKINARINPYSTAVAALVDRLSSPSFFIVPPLTEVIVPEGGERRTGRLTI